MAEVFEFKDYKAFLRRALEERKKTERGASSRLAEAIGCRPAYVTHVLRGDAHLSAEQANAASEFFGHTEDEAQYFLLLAMHGRAGTKRLRDSLARQIEKLREQHLNLEKRFSMKAITAEDQAIFYGNWQYVAILTMLGIPAYQSKEAIASHLGIPLQRVSEVIEQLLQMGLLKLEGRKYVPGARRTHLGRGSPHLARHHLNWRMQAMQSIDRSREADLHYSSVLSLSEEDFHVLRARLVAVLEEAVNKIVVPSPAEKVASLCLDFFGL